MSQNSQLNKTVDTLILGAGLTGLSAASVIKGDYLVAEASSKPGGTASTLIKSGFYLDRGVHILYFRDDRIRKWITDDLHVPLVPQRRKSSVWLCDKIIPFPIQFNLSSLPVKPRIQSGFSAIKSILGNREPRKIVHLNNWAEKNFGRFLADNFFGPYNKKVWGIPYNQITAEWMDGYVPRPAIRELVRGLIKHNSNSYGTNATFWYPDTGGISALPTAIAKNVDNIHYNKQLRALNPFRRIAEFHDGSEIGYQKLVSTIPLPILLDCLTSGTDGPIEHFGKLKSNPVTFAHVLVPRAGLGNGHHWIYYPQEEIPFYRVTFPHNISSNNCPAGWSALTLEIGGRLDNVGKLEVECKQALINLGLLNPSERDAKVVWDGLEHGYVTYDDNWNMARRHVLTWLREFGIICLGRYGRWEYSNMESALIQGRSINTRIETYRNSPKHSLPADIEVKNIAVKSYFANHYPQKISGPKKLIYKRGIHERLPIINKWIPNLEGLKVLDAGCGDGDFLDQLLYGQPSKLRLEDLVQERAELSHKKLLLKADVIESSTIDCNMSSDQDRYDLVFALGIFDYERNWPSLLANLSVRCKGTMIIDFPKSKTFHEFCRKWWLRKYGIRLKSADRYGLEALLKQHNYSTEIVELPLQWLVCLSIKNGDCNNQH
jgi:protoporphyrinogen oxidase